MSPLVQEGAPALAVAVGNRFRRDDGVAPAVLDELRRRRDEPADGRTGPRVDLVELDGEPTRLIDTWTGRATVVVLDAVHDPRRAPGELVVVEGWEALASWYSGCSSHSGGVADALRLGQVLRRLPERLVVVGVVVGDLGEGPGLSPAVKAAVPTAADAVVALAVATHRRGPRHVPG